MAYKIAQKQASWWAARLLLAVGCAFTCLASVASQAHPCTGFTPAPVAVPGKADEAAMVLRFMPSAKFNCTVSKVPRHAAKQAATPTVILVFATLTPLLRREKGSEQLEAEARAVRKHPNRWLGKVLGTAPSKQSFASQRLAPQMPSKHAVHHSLHTGTKRATVRRSRYA